MNENVLKGALERVKRDGNDYDAVRDVGLLMQRYGQNPEQLGLDSLVVERFMKSYSEMLESEPSDLVAVEGIERMLPTYLPILQKNVSKDSFWGPVRTYLAGVGVKPEFGERLIDVYRKFMQFDIRMNSAGGYAENAKNVIDKLVSKDKYSLREFSSFWKHFIDDSTYLGYERELFLEGIAPFVEDGVVLLDHYSDRTGKPICYCPKIGQHQVLEEYRGRFLGGNSLNGSTTVKNVVLNYEQGPFEVRLRGGHNPFEVSLRGGHKLRIGTVPILNNVSSETLDALSGNASLEIDIIEKQLSRQATFDDSRLIVGKLNGVYDALPPEPEFYEDAIDDNRCSGGVGVSPEEIFWGSEHPNIGFVVDAIDAAIELRENLDDPRELGE